MEVLRGGAIAFFCNQACILHERASLIEQPLDGVVFAVRRFARPTPGMNFCHSRETMAGFQGGGKGQRTDSRGNRVRRNPGCNDVVGCKREMFLIVVPGRAAAVGLLGQQVNVIQARSLNAGELG